MLQISLLTSITLVEDYAAINYTRAPVYAATRKHVRNRIRIRENPRANTDVTVRVTSKETRDRSLCGNQGFPRASTAYEG